jgi:hypothetical protein
VDARIQRSGITSRLSGDGFELIAIPDVDVDRYYELPMRQESPQTRRWQETNGDNGVPNVLHRPSNGGSTRVPKANLNVSPFCACFDWDPKCFGVPSKASKWLKTQGCPCKDVAMHE